MATITYDSSGKPKLRPMQGTVRCTFPTCPNVCV